MVSDGLCIVVECSRMTQVQFKSSVTLPDETFLADVCMICRRRMHTNSPPVCYRSFFPRIPEVGESVVQKQEFISL